MTKEMNEDSRKVRLRPAEPADEQFLMAVYASTRAQEMSLVPWNEEQKEAFLRMQFNAQAQFYDEKFPQSEHLIILAGEQAVGRLYISRENALIRILDITILPEHRGKGIGTPIIREIADEGKRTGRPVQIYVESFNPSLRLFERLGFKRIGEEGFNLLLEKQV